MFDICIYSVSHVTCTIIPPLKIKETMTFHPKFKFSFKPDSFAGELLPLGHFFSSPGFTDEHAYLFLARGVEMTSDGHAHEESEAISDCRAFRPVEIARMIAANEIRDANTLSVCARLVARGLLQLQT